MPVCCNKVGTRSYLALLFWCMVEFMFPPHIHTKSNALQKSIRINAPLSRAMRYHRQRKKKKSLFWTWTFLGSNYISNIVALSLNSLALLDPNWLAQNHLSSLWNHCTGWTANQTIFPCMMGKDDSNKLVVSSKRIFRQNSLLQIVELSFSWQRL